MAGPVQVRNLRWPAAESHQKLMTLEE